MATFGSVERLDVLDGLRGLAIALVVWYHAWLVSGQSIAGVNFMAEAGFLGVDLFFFISGCCLFFPYARAMRDGRPTPATRRFFLRRAVKILPSYVLALVVFAIVYHARFASPGEAFIQIASHLTFLHTLTPLTFGAISGPLWTIGVEVQFYLLFPLVCPMFRKSPVWAYAGLIVFSETYRFIVGRLGLGSSFLFINQLPAYLDVFGSGMFAAYALTRLPMKRTGGTTLAATAVSIGAFSLAVATLAKISEVSRLADFNAAYDWVNAVRVVVGPLCVILAISTTLAFGRWQSLISTRALVFLSMISYNLYLWNLEIAVWYHQAGLGPAATFVSSIATTLVLSTAITYVIERPILEADIPRQWSAFIGRLSNRDSRTADG